MKSSEPLKADGKGRRTKGGHRLDANARPGGKGPGFKNHEASVFSWARSANRSRNPGEGLGPVEATGRSPERAAP